MKEIDTALLLRLLREEHLMKPGESDSFAIRINGRVWEMTLKRESEDYLPFKYSLKGRCTEPTIVGTHATWGRRYKTMDAALLHCFNAFNENANVRDRYNSIEEVLSMPKNF